MIPILTNLRNKKYLVRLARQTVIKLDSVERLVIHEGGALAFEGGLNLTVGGSLVLGSAGCAGEEELRATNEYMKE